MSASNRSSPPDRSAAPASPADSRWRLVNRTMRLHHHLPDALIETLHAVQSAFGFLDPQSMRYVAETLHVPLSRVYAVATFYNHFNLKPPGAHTCVVCQGTACYIGGASEILAALRQAFDLDPGQTTPDGQISLLTARCIGACGIAPAAVFDQEVAGKVQPQDAVEHLRRWSVHDDDARRTAGDR